MHLLTRSLCFMGSVSLDDFRILSCGAFCFKLQHRNHMLLPPTAGFNALQMAQKGYCRIANVLLSGEQSFRGPKTLPRTLVFTTKNRPQTWLLRAFSRLPGRCLLLHPRVRALGRGASFAQWKSLTQAGSLTCIWSVHVTCGCS